MSRNSPTKFPTLKFEIHKGLAYCFFYGKDKEIITDGEKNVKTTESTRVIETLKGIGFEVNLHVNIHHEDLNATFTEIQKKDMEGYDAFLLLFVTTFKIKGKLNVGGGMTYPVRDIINKFKGDRCPKLAGKPKILVFQCVEVEKQGDVQNDFAQGKQFLPVAADMLVINSSYKGGEETEDAPSFFLESFCSMLNSWGCSSSPSQIVLPESLVKLNSIIVEDRLKNQQNGNPNNRSEINQRCLEIMSSLRGSIILRPDAKSVAEDAKEVIFLNKLDGIIFNFYKYGDFSLKEINAKDDSYLKEILRKKNISLASEEDDLPNLKKFLNKLHAAAENGLLKKVSGLSHENLKKKFETYGISLKSGENIRSIKRFLKTLENEDSRIRRGSDRDVEALKENFQTYDISLESKQDLPKTEFTDNFKTAIGKSEVKNLTVVMGHGLENEIELMNNESLRLKILHEYFTDKKINILIYQLCRGSNAPHAVSSSVQGDPSIFSATFEDNAEASPINKDNVLIFWSTFYGEHALRNVEDGSWFIQELCNVIKELHDEPKDYNFLDVCMETCYRVAKNHNHEKYRQIPVFNMTLTKHIYLNAAGHLEEQSKKKMKL